MPDAGGCRAARCECGRVRVAVVIIELSRAEALPLATNLGEIYAAAFGYPASAVERFARIYTECVSDYGGARVLAACAGGHVIGFAYGFTFQHGHWWPEQIAPALAATGQAVWMEDAFELVELIVHPDHHGSGQGTALLEHLLRTMSEQRALLGTAPDNPAQRLYRRTGFVDLLPDFQYGETGPAAVIMGYADRP